jgi:hypothetical protein
MAAATISMLSQVGTSSLMVRALLYCVAWGLKGLVLTKTVTVVQQLFTLAGGTIIFIWAFLSWAGINLHIEEQQYTPLEADVLAAIAETGLEPGMYAMGQGSPEGGEEAKWADWVENFQDKPWGVLNYQASNEMTFGMNLFRGFSIDLIIAFLLFSLMSKVNASSLKEVLIVTLTIGFIAFLIEDYSGYIWFKSPGIMAHLIDAVVPWSLLGLVYWKMK